MTEITLNDLKALYEARDEAKSVIIKGDGFEQYMALQKVFYIARKLEETMDQYFDQQANKSGAEE